MVTRLQLLRNRSKTAKPSVKSVATQSPTMQQNIASSSNFASGLNQPCDMACEEQNLLKVNNWKEMKIKTVQMDCLVRGAGCQDDQMSSSSVDFNRHTTFKSAFITCCPFLFRHKTN
nr:uncharacterized protein LOC106681569 [Halyomorpha halys]